ncbi:Ctr copper transporter family-domain-containing protein [Lipomyces arxii]|uniref:Ctr copper transporter family-domain-containing protein n=1 Tax=Lipomyces arxii TaxID=56418 RepID=UPI0034CECBA6
MNPFNLLASATLHYSSPLFVPETCSMDNHCDSVHMTSSMKPMTSMPGGDMGNPHSGHDVGVTCKMNMVFTWDPTDVCVVFRWWHIKGTLSFVVSLIAVMALGVGFEYIRAAITNLSNSQTTRTLEMENLLDDSISTSSTLHSVPADPRRKFWHTTVVTPRWLLSSSKKNSLLGPFLYGLQVVFSLLLMLIAMTYNGWIILALGTGAAIGNWLYSETPFAEGRSMSCH